MFSLRVIAGAALVAGAAALVWLFWPAHTQVHIPAGVSLTSSGMAERGAYVVRAAGCTSCHTDRKRGGQAFAGGRALKTPFGVFYTPNLTPNVETGIGGWSDEDFVRAVTLGEGIHGEELYPVFPYTSYSAMSVDDVLAIKAHLFTLRPVKVERRDNEISFPFSWRALMKGWKLLFFGGARMEIDDATRDVDWNRGRYLVTALGHCGECHTPRNILGALNDDAQLRGNRDGPDGWRVPALVGATKSNFANWSVEEIAEYLKSGVKPDFDSVQGPMAEVIEDNTKHLTPEDRRAIALYLKSLNQH